MTGRQIFGSPLTTSVSFQTHRQMRTEIHADHPVNVPGFLSPFPSLIAYTV